MRIYLSSYLLVSSQLVAVEIPGNKQVTTEFKYKNRLLLLYVMSAKACTHLKQVNQNIKPKTPNGCEECMKIGSDWVHLRLCLTCGHVGCCDSSPNKHATKHFRATRHPIIRSFEPGEDWKWCYIDDIMA
jgi:uncharacterized UBP type Zn finger protein